MYGLAYTVIVEINFPELVMMLPFILNIPQYFLGFTVQNLLIKNLYYLLEFRPPSYTFEIKHVKW